MHMGRKAETPAKTKLLRQMSSNVFSLQCRLLAPENRPYADADCGAKRVSQSTWLHAFGGVSCIQNYDQRYTYLG